MFGHYLLRKCFCFENQAEWLKLSSMQEQQYDVCGAGKCSFDDKRTLL